MKGLFTKCEKDEGHKRDAEAPWAGNSGGRGAGGAVADSVGTVVAEGKGCREEQGALVEEAVAW